LVSLATIIAFWKRKDTPKTSEPARIIPLPSLAGATLEAPPPSSPQAFNEAKETLKVLKLERQILGSAVTTIYESHSKGIISEAERDRMLEKYKVDLKRLEKGIDENQQVVDLHDLAVEREELVKNFETKLAEIDARLNALKSGSQGQKPEKDAPRGHSGNHMDQTRRSGGDKGNSDPQPMLDSEKRIDQIREEILRAMDRLEQIETEG